MRVLLDNIPAKRLSFNKGDTIFAQNSTVERLYFVVSGRVKLVRENVEGGALVIHIAYAGESFAEASLFADDYHCHCVADGACELLSFSKNRALAFLQQNPDLMMALIKNLTAQVRDLRLLSEIKSIYSANSRVMAFLQSEANQGVFHYAYSLVDLAHKIGLAQATLYRTLSVLEEEGKIIKQQGCIALVGMI